MTFRFTRDSLSCGAWLAACAPAGLRAVTPILFGILTMSAIPAHAQDADAAPPSSVGALDLQAQLHWLQHAARDGALARLDDAQLVALFAALDPRTLERYIAVGPNGYGEYEFTLRHRERVGMRWPATADHLLVRLAHDPLRLYARWLPDGAHAGQEVLYDAASRPDALYGHAGGVFGLMSIWTPLDGAFARSQSHHRLTDLGTEAIARRFLDGFPRLAAAGAAKPSRIAVQTRDGVRVVALTWVTPSETDDNASGNASDETRGNANGPTAARETLGLDLRHAWFRTVQSYDGAGRPLEDVVIEHIEPKRFGILTFDARNPDYRF
ncbi:DUF1571 domain-containing protein [Paraburkholderia acidisoli]|uniref:DUF1571 domain-containing protein n=1 Tax=Paraburkholderia acidisoli TaxID=2571748 RepID=A0A7Z2JF89_9BURK|nr:DUF1571 domain-containing protein [Paraburkholderia acidisoli]QGZ61688.1 DUF1571 domain-containing protein [Paraburkholderia acidisoli]